MRNSFNFTHSYMRHLIEVFLNLKKFTLPITNYKTEIKFPKLKMVKNKF